MHRTELSGQESWAAVLLVRRDGHVLAAEHERRRGDTCDLTREPRANQPRQTLADEQHERIELTMGFGMMGIAA